MTVIPASCADGGAAKAKMEKSSLVSPGDRIAIHWPMDDGSTKPFDGEVTHCKASHENATCASGERRFRRYAIRFADGDVRKSRLRHLAWCRLDSAQDEQTGPQDKRKRLVAAGSASLAS